MTYPPSVEPRRPATLDELARLRDQGHAVELIDGEIVYKASPAVAHGASQMRFGEVLAAFNRQPGGPRGPGGWWLMTEVDIFYPLRTEVFRHDVSGFRRDRHPERPSGMPVNARPDWACEILSPSTARYDVVKKSRTLHAHGVPHYWLLDPERETLTVLRHTEQGYLQVLTASVGDVVRAEPFDAIELSVSELFGHDE